MGRNAADGAAAAANIGPGPDQKDFIMECTVSTAGNNRRHRARVPLSGPLQHRLLPDGRLRWYRRIGRKPQSASSRTQNAAVDASAGFAVGVRHRPILTVLDDEFTVHIDGLAALTGRGRPHPGQRAWRRRGSLSFLAAVTLARFEDVSVRPL